MELTLQKKKNVAIYVCFPCMEAGIHAAKQQERLVPERQSRAVPAAAGRSAWGRPSSAQTVSLLWVPVVQK